MKIHNHMMLWHWVAGATFTFSGPLHPAELGAAVAAADIHLSPERDDREQRLMKSIDYVRDRLIEHQWQTLDRPLTEVWFVRVGSLDNAIELGKRMLDDGFYVNLSGFPVVPMGMDGIRFTTTLFQSDDHLEQFMDSLARHLPGLVVPMDGDVNLL